MDRRDLRQKKKTQCGCTVTIVPEPRNQDVENAVISILMESYEERLSQAVVRE